MRPCLASDPCCFHSTGSPKQPQDIRETVAANSISSVPTFVAYRGGSAVSAFSGADRAQLLRMARELTGQSTGGDPV